MGFRSAREAVCGNRLFRGRWYVGRGPVGTIVMRRERARTALQEAERRRRRAQAEKALEDRKTKLALVENQKVGVPVKEASVRS